jgi:hypothetical protein
MMGLGVWLGAQGTEFSRVASDPTPSKLTFYIFSISTFENSKSRMYDICTVENSDLYLLEY